MSLLRSLFNFRDQSGTSDAEKPFLDHLEDLRVTLMKMGTVLALSMILSFCFRNTLTALIEKPYKDMGLKLREGKALTVHERLLGEFSGLAVLAAERVAGKESSPEARQALSKAVVEEFQATYDKKAFDEMTKLLEAAGSPAERGELINLDITESFTIAMKLAFFAGIGLSFPFQLYFIIGFVLPALTRKEKRLLGPGILAGSILFAAGVYVGFSFILPKTLTWFHDFAQSMGFDSTWKAASYFSFATQLCLACGLLCELPLVMVVLSVLNVISFGMLQATRKYAVAIILVIVAIIAPTPDPITFFTLAIPMLTIFEGSIWLVWLIERNRRKKEMSGQTLGD